MARHESFRAMPTQPIPYGPKQQPQPARKDVVAVNQSVSGDCHTCGQVKREIHQQISTAPLAPQPKSAAIPIPGISMPMAFQQQPIPIQFGAPGPQQMPVTLPIGNAPQIPQQMFVHNLQSHPLQPQAMIHHGQSMAFGPQINHQLGPQLGNLGIGIAPPLFSQQQQQQQTPGKFAGPRKTPAVKITHPETHEVLKLDKTMDSFADGGSLGQRPHNNAIPQSQPMASFAPTHYFTQLPPNSYNRPPIFFPTSTSVTPGSQPPWFSYPGGQAISFLNPPPLATASSGPIHGSVKLTAVQVGPKVGSSVPIRMPANKVELKSARPPVKAPVVHQQKSNDACVTDKSEACVTVVHKDGPTASVASGPKEKVPSESVKAKPVTGKKKKKRERLSKADAAGTSDLYNAYKGPEEKLQHANPSESVDSSHVVDNKIINADNHETVVVTVEEDGQSKAEVDDWEDVADISTVKLENGKQVNGDGTEATGPKKYTRDFLLTFSGECTDLPVKFEIGSDIADTLMSVPTGNCRVGDRDPYPSPGRSDRSTGISPGDRCGMSMMDDYKWTNFTGALITAPGSVGRNFCPGQGVNYGVLKNPRGQPLNQFYPFFPGPTQSMMPQGGPVDKNSDADRCRSLNNSRGLMPSPQAPLQVMHKAEKYEVGEVSDEEQAEQRQLKGILNKLTPQNFEKLFQQVRDVNIDNTTTLCGVIAQIFDKALMEPTFCEMYANFCFHLSGVLPDFTENDEKITFKRLLLNKCQEEIERGEREQAEADRVAEEGGAKQSEEGREEKRIKARRRMLGNIRLMGELYKKNMLTERIMHECIQKLLEQHENPDEENLEALCKLMSTIGDQIDHVMDRVYMDVYFYGMKELSTNKKLSSRVRFMLRDVIDLRKNRWQQRSKVEGPKN